ncbi:PLP-dependent aminotransferase family protein [Diaphorobacter ruginosibacter]|uniref:PLP-dependent aminotransferase family protein n=1 Tax=Diaphorobacter ruginosibacter TaxID=1715720 RepID=A0A7G9RT88_9BURK|nr:PLP-dependent aminotransferase family protein [Diaphorobacter ruginosibacter]QNN58813.1 PLP-dependent aminotransferase family protein [Diaphorobacter ruginosibacter]
MKLYEKLANDIEQQIQKGVYRDGERLQSVRETSRQRQISITTVLRAYLQLESRGLIASRPQSGFFVNLRKGAAHAGAADVIERPRPIPLSASVDVSRLVLSTLRTISSGDATPLGSPYPDPVGFPFDKLNRYVFAAGKDASLHDLKNALPPGHPKLLRQIIRRHLDQGLAVDPAEAIITVGATEAINLCLQAVAKPGDVIAVESPTFYAMLHAIERMGMKVIEVPTDPVLGIDVDMLARLAREMPIAACMVMPNFQNPLGYRMPDERKQALVQLANELDIPIIENGVYNELYYGDAPPSTLKSFDTRGLVLHCSSFSKTLTSVYRIGWALTGRYRDQVEKLKFLNTLTTPSIPQLAIAEYLERDGFDHQLRRLRKTYGQNARLMRHAVSRFFPEGTRVSSPEGGYVLWVELPGKIDGMQLYQQALEHGITVGPGYMFSVSNSYPNFIRLNYSSPWSNEIEQAVITIGKIAANALR